MLKVFARLGLMLAVPWMLNVQPADAASFESRNFDQLAAEAEQIVVATASGASARRTGPREIVTDFVFTDVKAVKGGAVKSPLTVTMLGGAVGSDALTVPGAPTFENGTRYVVFIAGNGSVMFPLVGGPQGIFKVLRDANGTTRIHDYAGRPVTRLPGAAAPVYTDRPAGETPEPISEDDFIAAIQKKLGK